MKLKAYLPVEPTLVMLDVNNGDAAGTPPVPDAKIETVSGIVPPSEPKRPSVTDEIVRFDDVPVLKPCAIQLMSTGSWVPMSVLVVPSVVDPDAPRLPKTISAWALREQKATAASVAATPRERMKSYLLFMRQFLSKTGRTTRGRPRETNERRTNRQGLNDPVDGGGCQGGNRRSRRR